LNLSVKVLPKMLLIDPAPDSNHNFFGGQMLKASLMESEYG